eukprot:scaffold10626_cov112-Cylindrotheca_fusiformis.AAC.6
MPARTFGNDPRATPTAKKENKQKSVTGQSETNLVKKNAVKKHSAKKRGRVAMKIKERYSSEVWSFDNTIY